MELISLQHEIRDKNQQIANFEAKYALLDEKFQRILANHKATLAHLDHLKAIIERERQKNRLLSEENQKIQIENARIHDAKLKNEQLLNEIEALKEMNAQLEAGLLGERKLIEDQETKKYKKQIASLKEERDRLEKLTRKQFKKYIEYQKAAAESKALVAALRKKIQDLEDELERLRAERDSLQSQLRKCQSKKNNMRHDIENLERSLREKDILLDKLRAELEQCRENCRKRKATEDDLRRQIDELRRNPKIVYIEKPTLVEAPKNEPPPTNFNYAISKNVFIFVLKSIHFTGNYPYDEYLPMFSVVDFFQHESELTEVLIPENDTLTFNTTFKYGVEMNDYLMYYLATNGVPVQLHVASGKDSDLIGQLMIPLKDTMTSSNLIQGTIPLQSPDTDEIFGEVHYDLYFENPLPTVVDGNMQNYLNSLNDYQQSITDLKSAMEFTVEIGSISMANGSSQSSAAYNFFNFAPYETRPDPSSDRQVFYLQRNHEVLQYIQRESLNITILRKSKVVGKASVPLASLHTGNVVNGEFTILEENTMKKKGTIQVSIQKK